MCHTVNLVGGATCWAIGTSELEKPYVKTSRKATVLHLKKYLCKKLNLGRASDVCHPLRLESVHGQLLTGVRPTRICVDGTECSWTSCTTARSWARSTRSSLSSARGGLARRANLSCTTARPSSATEARTPPFPLYTTPCCISTVWLEIDPTKPLNGQRSRR